MNKLASVRRTVRLIGAMIVFVFLLMIVLIDKLVSGVEIEAKTIMYILNSVSLLAGVFIFLASFHINFYQQKENKKLLQKQSKK